MSFRDFAKKHIPLQHRRQPEPESECSGIYYLVDPTYPDGVWKIGGEIIKYEVKPAKPGMVYWRLYQSLVTEWNSVPIPSDTFISKAAYEARRAT